MTENQSNLCSACSMLILNGNSDAPLVKEHIRSCPECRELNNTMIKINQLNVPDENCVPPQHVEQLIQESAAEHLRKTRLFKKRLTRSFATAAAIFCLCSFLAVFNISQQEKHHSDATSILAQTTISTEWDFMDDVVDLYDFSGELENNPLANVTLDDEIFSEKSNLEYDYELYLLSCN